MDSFSEVVESLCHIDGTLLRDPQRLVCPDVLPSRPVIIEIVEKLRSILFPGYFGINESKPQLLKYHIGFELDAVQKSLTEQVRRSLCFSCASPKTGADCDKKALEVTAKFIESLPKLRGLLLSDVQASFEGDPAALSPDETIFCYPGIRAVTNQRIAHELYKLNVPILPRIITEHAHSRTGIDIHPGAQIGNRFFIDHGTGVVIGETCIIGNNVRLYQGVTLGAKSFPVDDNGHPIKSIPRHPILEDDVIVYAGATILGRITIGAGSVISGNVWLTHSVAAGSKIAQPKPQELSQ